MSLKHSTIICSYPRSGLHLLSLALYILDGNNVDLCYKNIWSTDDIPSYKHYIANSPSSTAPHQLQDYKKIILLLRNPCTHFSSIPPDHVSPGDLRPVHKGGKYHFPGGRKKWDSAWYAEFITHFDRLAPNKPDQKMVVYYEDLIQNNEIFLEVADFVGINQSRSFVGRPGAIDFDYIRDEAMRIYLEEKHIPSKKQDISKKVEQQIFDEIRLHINDDEIFDRYLKRYTQEKEIM